MEVKDRLLAFLKHIDMTQTEFCTSIDVSNAFISSMRKSIQPDKLKSIALKYPSLSIKWLMTGIGDMIEETPQSYLQDQTAIYNHGQQETLREKELRHQVSQLLDQQKDFVEIIKTQSELLKTKISSNNLGAHLDESAEDVDASGF